MRILRIRRIRVDDVGRCGDRPCEQDGEKGRTDRFPERLHRRDQAVQLAQIASQARVVGGDVDGDYDL